MSSHATSVLNCVVPDISIVNHIRGLKVDHESNALSTTQKKLNSRQIQFELLGQPNFKSIHINLRAYILVTRSLGAYTPRTLACNSSLKISHTHTKPAPLVSTNPYTAFTKHEHIQIDFRTLLVYLGVQQGVKRVPRRSLRSHLAAHI